MSRATTAAGRGSRSATRFSRMPAEVKELLADGETFRGPAWLPGLEATTDRDAEAFTCRRLPLAA